MNRQYSNGVLFALGASLALSGSFVFSKSALNQLNMVEFGLIWFALGVIWNSAWFLSRKEYRSLVDQGRKKTAVAILVALLEGGGTGLFYLAIQAMENPAIVSFIGNIGPVFVTVMGFFLLGERFNRLQVAGIILAISGIFIINYREGGFAGFLDHGSLYVISASFLFSLATIAGRKYHQYLVPGYMSLIRSMLLAAVMCFLFLRSGSGLPDKLTVWRDLLAGSFLETLLVIVMAYQALKLIEATKTSLIISTKGVWTLILAWIFLGVFPSWMEISGGFLTLIGVWLISGSQLFTPQE